MFRESNKACMGACGVQFPEHMSAEWFTDLLNQRLALPGVTLRSLAKDLGVSHVALHSYTVEGGSKPRVETAMRLLELSGGDIARALPGWKPESPDHREIEALRREVEDLRQRVRIAAAVLSGEGGEGEWDDDDDLMEGVTGLDVTESSRLGARRGSADRAPGSSALPPASESRAVRQPGSKAPE